MNKLTDNEREYLAKLLGVHDSDEKAETKPGFRGGQLLPEQPPRSMQMAVPPKEPNPPKEQT